MCGLFGYRLMGRVLSGVTTITVCPHNILCPILPVSEITQSTVFVFEHCNYMVFPSHYMIRLIIQKLHIYILKLSNLKIHFRACAHHSYF